MQIVEKRITEIKPYEKKLITEEKAESLIESYMLGYTE